MPVGKYPHKQMEHRRKPENSVPDAVIRARHRQFIASCVAPFEYDQRWDIQAAMRELCLPPGTRDIMSRAFKEIRQNRANFHRRKRAATHELTMALMKNVPEPEYDQLTELDILCSAEASYIANHERELRRSINFKVMLDSIVEKAKQLYDLKSMIDHPDQKRPDVSKEKPPFDVMMKELRGHYAEPSLDSDEPDSGYDDQSENSDGQYCGNSFGDHNAQCYREYEQYPDNPEQYVSDVGEQFYSHDEQLRESNYPQCPQHYMEDNRPQQQHYGDSAERHNDREKYEYVHSNAKVQQGQRSAPPPSPHPSMLPAHKLPQFLRGGPPPRNGFHAGGEIIQSSVRPAIRAHHRQEPLKLLPSPKPNFDIQNHPQIRKMQCREQFMPMKAKKSSCEQLTQTQLPEINPKKRVTEQLPKMMVREKLPKKTISEPLTKTRRGKIALNELVLPDIQKAGQMLSHKALTAGNYTARASDNAKLPYIGVKKRSSVGSTSVYPSPPTQKKPTKSQTRKVKLWK